MDRYHALYESVHRLNGRAIILVLSILPGSDDYQTFFPLSFGLNFALEKWCAMSQGRRIFIATHKVFLRAGQPKWERFSRSDNVHPNGPGTEILGKCYSRVLPGCGS